MVKALLEASEITLRGDIKRRIPRASVTDLRVVEQDLRFSAGAEPVVLGLGAAEAARWARNIAMPPPDLRQKLGLGSGAKAFACGDVGIAVLSEALAGAITATSAEAAMTVAVVSDAAELAACLETHASLPAGRPIWIVHGRGRAAPFGENAVRQIMRACGFIDTKVAAVSEHHTATRYSAR